MHAGIPHRCIHTWRGKFLLLSPALLSEPRIRALVAGPLNSRVTRRVTAIGCSRNPKHGHKPNPGDQHSPKALYSMVFVPKSLNIWVLRAQGKAEIRMYSVGHRDSFHPTLLENSKRSDQRTRLLQRPQKVGKVGVDRFKMEGNQGCYSVLSLWCLLWGVGGFRHRVLANLGFVKHQSYSYGLRRCFKPGSC